jgi:solute carrier family 25 carnitine/acylcarnitine transporter 20/29
VRREGFASLYKGVVPPLAGLGALNAVLFSTYGPVLERLEQRDPGRHLWHVFLAGCAGGTAQSLLACPLELAKIRMQVNEGRALGTLQTARMVLRESGLRGLYRGLLPTLLRDAPSYGLWFLVYEWLKEQLTTRWLVSPAAEPLAQFAAGGLAGMAAWASIYPIDVAKSRVQSSTTPLRLVAAFRDGYREGGVRSFFQGFSTTMAKGFVCSGTTFVCVELLLVAIAKLRQ